MITKYIREPTIYVDRETGEIISKEKFDNLTKKLLICAQKVDTKTLKKGTQLIIKTIKSYETDKRQQRLF